MTEFLKYDQQSNQIGLKFLEMCENDIFCRSKLPKPIESTKRVFDMIENKNHCQNITKLLTKEEMRFIFFILIRSREEELRILIPPIIYRFLRCNNQDQMELNHFLHLMKPKNFSYRDYTELVFANIGISEMLYNSTNIPSIRDLDIERNLLYFSSDTSIFSRNLKDIWPTYKTDEYYNLFAKTNIPFLMVQGNLDPQTIHPQAIFLYEKLKRNENQHLVIFENLQHRIIARGDCSYNIIIEFMKNPLKRPNITCTNDKIIDFIGNDQETKRISQKYFNSKLWK